MKDKEDRRSAPFPSMAMNSGDRSRPRPSSSIWTQSSTRTRTTTRTSWEQRQPGFLRAPDGAGSRAASRRELNIQYPTVPISNAQGREEGECSDSRRLIRMVLTTLDLDLARNRARSTFGPRRAVGAGLKPTSPAGLQRVSRGEPRFGPSGDFCAHGAKKSGWTLDIPCWILGVES